MRIDFNTQDFIDLKIALFEFIKKQGQAAFGDQYHGISPAACEFVEKLVSDIQNKNLKVRSPAILESYFQQNYIMLGFCREEGNIGWHPQLEPSGSKKYFVDFTRFGDLPEVQFELKDFIKKLGRHEFGEDYVISGQVNDGLTRLLDRDLYGRNHGNGYIIKTPRDLSQFFSQQGHIMRGFETYKKQIKWMRKGKSERDQEFQSLDGDCLIDFTNNNIRVLKLQVDVFLMKAGREFHARDYSISKTIMKQVDRLLNLRYYGLTQEHNITKPEDLDKFFYQRFVQQAFRRHHNDIKWAKPLTRAPKHLFRRYFNAPMMRPPLRRVPTFKNPMVCRESWREEPLTRKMTQQEELFWQAVNLRRSIKSPVELMPTVYAQKEAGGNGTVWWSAKFAASATGTFNLVSHGSLPVWLNNVWNHIEFNGSQMGHETFLNDSSHTSFGPDEDFTVAQNTVYCLVVYVMDFARWHLFNCACKGHGGCNRGPCPIQVYVGRALNGLVDRWVTQRYAHTRVTKRVVNFMHELRDRAEPYQKYEHGSADSGVQLPQCMLGLAKENHDPAALFVLKSCESKGQMEKFERELIRDLKAKDMSKGLNVKDD